MARSTRRWVLIVVILAALCAGGILFVHSQRAPGAWVRITQDGEVIATVPLDEPQTLTLTSAAGGHNTVVIKDGTVAVTQADCPDQVCVHHGPTSQTADPIACLPNRLVVEVVAQPPEGGAS